MKDHERKEYRTFYETLYNLYARKGGGKYVFPLLLFLVANREHLFMFSKKNRVSQLIEIAKQAKGESS